MRRCTAALLPALALVAVACSTDGSRGEATTTAPSPPTAAPTTTTAPATAPTTTSAPVGSAAPATSTTVQPGSRGDGSGAALGEALVTIDDPTTLAVRAGDDRFYVASRDGTVWSWLPGSDPTVALDLTDATDGRGEQGLLGIAFAPDGTRLYVDYTGDDDGATHVDELTVAADGTIDAGSRREVLVVEQPHDNHNGGQLEFGPDGLLYIGLGDGGSAGDPDRRALDPGDLLGKILRIDPAGDPYAVPADNPYAGVDGARAEVWSIGLRNPWRFSFDPATGDLWIGDVGQGEWEEIDHAPAVDGRGAGRGANFGWSAFEGSHRYHDDQPDTATTPPIHEYDHDDGCSVTGGEVYRGTALPELIGWYVFADYCEGTVWALQTVADDDGVLRAGELIEIGRSADVAAIERGPDGELYVLSLSEGVRPIVAS